MEKSNLFWQTYLNIEHDVVKLSKYIYFTDKNKQLEVYSPYIADMLVKCCVEIEAISKELYFENEGTKARGSKELYFDTDCLKLLHDKWNLDEKKVLIVASNFDFIKDESKILTPLKNSYKRSKAYWAKAYQAVKHDRYDSLAKGNIRALLEATASLFLLNIYFKDKKFNIKYKDKDQLDMTFGSQIFTLTQPNVADQLWYNNDSHSTDCPYIFKYTKEAYDRICLNQQNNNIAIQDYWKKQPELNEEEFLLILLDAQKKADQDSKQRVVHLWELSHYRLLKKIPPSLPFEVRKKIFCECPERNDRIYQNNKHLADNEITEENIDEEIRRLAINLGMSLENSLTTDWAVYATTEANCEVYIEKNSCALKAE